MTEGKVEPTAKRHSVTLLGVNEVEPRHDPIAKQQRSERAKLSRPVCVGFAHTKHEAALSVLCPVCAAHHVAVQEKAGSTHHSFL
jgi:hypothetical protein